MSNNGNLEGNAAVKQAVLQVKMEPGLHRAMKVIAASRDVSLNQLCIEAFVDITAKYERMLPQHLTANNVAG